MAVLRTRPFVIFASVLAAAILAASAAILFFADGPADDRLLRDQIRISEGHPTPRRRAATEKSVANGEESSNGDTSSTSLSAESSPAAMDDGPPNVFVRILGEDPELDDRARVEVDLNDAVQRSSVAHLNRRMFEAPSERTYAFSFPSGSVESFRSIECRYESESRRTIFRGVFDAATVASKDGDRLRLDLEIRPIRRHLVVGRVVGAEFAHMSIFPQSQPKFELFLDDDVWETRIEEDLTFRAWVPSLAEDIVIMAWSQGRSAARILRIDGDVDVGAIEIEKSPTHMFCGSVDVGDIEIQSWLLGLRPEASTVRDSASKISGSDATKDLDVARGRFFDGENSSIVRDDRDFEFRDVPPGIYTLVVEEVSIIERLDLSNWASSLRSLRHEMHPSLEKSSAVRVTIPSASSPTPFVYRPLIAEIVFERPTPNAEADGSVFLVTALNETTTIRFDSDISWENDEGRLLVPSKTQVTIDFIGNGAEPRRKTIVSPARGESIRIKASGFDSMERAPTSVINVRFSGAGGESIDDINASLETMESAGPAFVDLECVPNGSGAFRLFAAERLHGKHRLFMRFVHFSRSSGFKFVSDEYWATDSRVVDFGDGRDADENVEPVRAGTALIRAVSSDGLVLPASIRWKGGDHVVPTRGTWPESGWVFGDDDVPPLAPGRYFVDVTPSGHSPRAVEFTIKSGETTLVVVPVED